VKFQVSASLVHFQWKKSILVIVTNRLRANPTIVSYNASAVKIYNATSSLVCFKNKNILFYNVKCPSLASCFINGQTFLYFMLGYANFGRWLGVP
jgi:hypothetical protein